MLPAMDQIKKEFGKIIVQHRKKAGLSQEKYAEKSDIHVNQVSFIERGMVSPTVLMLYKLAKGLEIEPESLISELSNRLQ